MIKRILYIAVLCLFAASSYAQEMTISVEAPRVVAVGESFKVEFTMNHKPEEFIAPSFDGFEIVAGPIPSQSRMIQVTNSTTVDRQTHTYSYVLVAAKKGNFKIGEATVTYNKKKYRNKVLPIEVVEDEAAAGNTGSSGGKTTGVSANDVLLVMEVNKTSAYKGEAITARVKLLTKVQIAGHEGVKTPSFAGFWQQEVTNNEQYVDWERETYNGTIYESALIKEFLLFPQQNGAIVIEPMSMNIVLRVVDRNSGNSDPMFDGFFGGGGRYRNIKKMIATKPITINVKPYVGVAPASFSGAVGEFTMRSSISSDVMNANSASNIFVTINGNGNLPLITEPTLNLPQSFELYKVKSEEKIAVTANAVTGEKTYTYPFIARAKGDYKIEPIEFTYFSPSSAKFVTLRSDVYNVTVSSDGTSSGGGGSNEPIIRGVSKEELKILGSDIQYIITALPVLKMDGENLIFSTTYFIILISLIIICAVVLLLLRRMINEANDTVKVKSKRANRVALNRLKESKKFLDDANSSAFYDAVLKAMWGYVADKLNIDKASQSRDLVGEQLIGKGIEEEQKNKFISVISSCEEARYSPVASSMMGEVYNSAIEVITKFENKL